MHHYYLGADGVDTTKMRLEAEKLFRQGEGSVLHYHRHGELCNLYCEEYEKEEL